MTDGPQVRLGDFDNSWYRPGRGVVVRLIWMIVSRMFFLTFFPWPYALKRALLRLFGASVGHGVVVKPRVNIKYPWNLGVGSNAWIGEGAWLDNLARIEIGPDVCISQACMMETGNHDWSSPSFDLMLGPIVVERGAWAAVRSTLLPGSTLAEGAVLGAGSVLSGSTEAHGIYLGCPARKAGVRRIVSAGCKQGDAGQRAGAVRG